MPTESQRRRTFAIISHPDAGKTTLTEKLLLYGGAIHMAGAVKSRKAQRAATSDWMELEKKRGISITSSVLHFSYGGLEYNLLDTPGHQDFSEDTYRTLTAADCAIMLIDAAKGVEAQTRKLFAVCRQRGTPIVTFVNKLDRPSRDPFELMSEIEDVLQIPTVPRTWPIGSGDRFKGVYDREHRQVLLFEAGQKTGRAPVRAVAGFEDPQIDAIAGEELAREMREGVALIEGAGEAWEPARFLRGELTPVFFGSAITNFGVEPFLESFGGICPPPGPRKTSAGEIGPDDPRFSGFVFKVQANMDPQHRDRVAFLRVVSGKFEGGMRVWHYRLNKEIRLNRAEQFFAQERETVMEAYAGDIVGLYDPGLFRIGDTLSTGGPLAFDAVPRFSPEHFARLTLRDPMKRKQFQKGVDELAEEGTVQLFTQKGREKDPIVGVVGRLQFDVLLYRLEHEYGAKVELEPLGVTVARWVTREDGSMPPTSELEAQYLTLPVTDIDGRTVALLRDEYELRRVERDNPGWRLNDTAPIVAATAR
jgi:peptide chain release factor 3